MTSSTEQFMTSNIMTCLLVLKLRDLIWFFGFDFLMKTINHFLLKFDSNAYSNAMRTLHWSIIKTFVVQCSTFNSLLLLVFIEGQDFIYWALVFNWIFAQVKYTDKRSMFYSVGRAEQNNFFFISAYF